MGLIDCFYQSHRKWIGKFSWESYGKPYSVEGIDIIHVITKTGKARIDATEIGTYRHDYFHWYELVLSVKEDKGIDLSEYIKPLNKVIPSVGTDEKLEYQDFAGYWYEYTTELQLSPSFTPFKTRVVKK